MAALGALTVPEAHGRRLPQRIGRGRQKSLGHWRRAGLVHARFAGGTIVVYQKPGSIPMDLFERLRREDGWHHSVWNERIMVQHSDTKVHMAVNYTRFRADGSVIGVYDSLYVRALNDGRWGVQLRSSFGPRSAGNCPSSPRRGSTPLRRRAPGSRARCPRRGCPWRSRGRRRGPCSGFCRFAAVLAA